MSESDVCGAEQAAAAGGASASPRPTSQLTLVIRGTGKRPVQLLKTPTPLDLERVRRACSNQLHVLKKRDTASASLVLVRTDTRKPIISAADACSISSGDILEISGAGVSLPPPTAAEAAEMARLQASVAKHAARQPRSEDDEDEDEDGASGASASAAAADADAENADDDPVDAPEAQGPALRPVLFWKQTDKNGYLSNFSRSPFTADGLSFSCVEQFIMHSKAQLFGDAQAAERIMAASKPMAMKKQGRLVRNYKERTWAARRVEVQLAGLRAKFGQNPELAARLLKTGDKPIAEASPSDRIFGIGLAPSDPKAQDPANWRGTNILGKCLETVRSELQQGL